MSKTTTNNSIWFLEQTMLISVVIVVFRFLYWSFFPENIFNMLYLLLVGSIYHIFQSNIFAFKNSKNVVHNALGIHRAFSLTKLERFANLNGNALQLIPLVY